MINVIVVEDIKSIREGLVALIDGTPDYICKHSYDSCEKLFKELPSLNPDVILLDIQLKGMSGIEGIAKIKAIHKNVNIVMLTVYEDNKNIFDALMAGATGYLLKTTTPVQIIDAIKDANEGGSPMNPSIANKLINIMRDSSPKKNDKHIDLTEREKEILTKISKGMVYKKIADDLFISVHTVRYHIRNIYTKMQVNSHVSAISIAKSKGFIS
ncbi:MAG: response regulator transcription factor [Ignavibacteriales bacterium]|nr:response regulator transcription factor [Ignavibacteriales bacterium]MCB9260138.1 response regulator transcription factor [Ignavibacteriales bacterium]